MDKMEIILCSNNILTAKEAFNMNNNNYSMRVFRIITEFSVGAVHLRNKIKIKSMYCLLTASSTRGYNLKFFVGTFQL